VVHYKNPLFAYMYLVARLKGQCVGLVRHTGHGRLASTVGQGTGLKLRLAPNRRERSHLKKYDNIRSNFVYDSDILQFHYVSPKIFQAIKTEEVCILQ